MAAVYFLGDQVSAVGWRLAGVSIVVPKEGEEAARFAELLSQAELLLVTAELAEKVPQKLLEQALTSITPLVLVVPDVRGHIPVPDLAKRMQSQLGLVQ